jgi:hypothetical protein
MQSRIGESGLLEPASPSYSEDAQTTFQEPAMSSHMSHTEGSASFEIRFQSLFNEGRGLAFPCDAGGRVNLDALSDRGRNSHLFARAMVGREFSTPNVRIT